MKISWLEPNILAASGIPISADDLISLRDQGVRAILTLTENPLTTFRALFAEVFRNLDLTTAHIPIRDQHAPDRDHVPHILDFLTDMRAQNRPVLIHCHAGIGRTGTILHVYYLAQGLSLVDAQQRIQRLRPQSTLLSDEQRAFVAEYAASLKTS